MRILALALTLAAASPAAAHDFEHRSFGEEQRLRQRLYTLELGAQAAEHRARTEALLARQQARRPTIAAPDIDAQLAAQIEAASAAQIARIEASNARMLAILADTAR
ncbi:MAG TPA: hypothetical protein VD906_00465 [Caulobacteraceae bacterium]|nr:hypothetical protein [Caulobacteraceae bacterium]